MSRCLGTSATTHIAKSWANIEDSVVLLERNLYGHPLAGLLWKRQFEGLKIPNSECMFVHSKQLFLSGNVDDIKMAPMWKNLMKNVDIDEATSFLDHVYLGCTQSECKPNETIIEQFTKMFLPGWQKFQTKTVAWSPTTWRDMLKNALRDTANWQTRKWSNCTKFEVLAWMIINSSRRNSNQLENCL